MGSGNSRELRLRASSPHRSFKHVFTVYTGCCRYASVDCWEVLFHELYANPVYTEIAYTHHKYRKRLESDVALDAHGQPLDPDDEAVLGEEGIALRDQCGPTSGGYTDHGTAVVGAQRCL
jgi:hypothetical protein